MTDRPIIMSGNHPKLILDEIKTMTRRTYGLEKANREPDAWEFKRINNGGIALFWRKSVMEEDIALCKCPYGQVGDRLWVRETWATDKLLDYLPPRLLEGVATLPFWYLADSDQHSILQQGKWRPSIFMPRWASRITLEIAEIRVERIQDISANDVKAEGASWDFYLLWDSLNAKRGYGWEVNPWVWVINFKKEQKDE